MVGMTAQQTGRPTVMTKAVVQKLEQALRDGFSVDMACYVSGVGRSTYYEHLQSDPDFADKMTLAQDWTTQRAKQVVAQAVDNGDLKAAQWWLERRARAEFAANPPPVPESERPYFSEGDNDKFLQMLANTAATLAAERESPEVTIAKA
jgi:hypothetical protein